MAITPTVNSASEMQMDYMKLLITQLQNQNPLEPLSNNEMAAQMAQFSQLQHLETMSTSFTEVLETTNRTYANSMLGKNVSFYATDEETGELNQVTGSVDSVFNDPETNESLLIVSVNAGEQIDKYTISLDGVLLVGN